jgi:O-acetyl-ADP-ribose deacetylase (regulator of RNase III)
MTDELLGGHLIVKTGDITRESVDAIVNAANSSLMGGGGVDGAIHRTGGPAILEECKEIRAEKYPEGLATGQAVVTIAGNLPAQWVIHTVGPVWHGGQQDEERLLGECYRNSIGCALELKAETIAFPAISTGVYHFPKDRAARIAFGAIRDFLEAHTEITVLFVFFSESDKEIFLKSVKTI